MPQFEEKWGQIFRQPVDSLGKDTVTGSKRGKIKWYPME
jgi:hypothetical protein